MRFVLCCLLSLCSAASAADAQLPAHWAERVNESDNPEAKAKDMVNDWCFDHRKELEAMDEVTLARGLKIVEWMDSHGYSLPEKVADLVQHLELNAEFDRVLIEKTGHDALKIEAIPLATPKTEAIPIPASNEGEIIVGAPETPKVQLPPKEDVRTVETHTTYPNKDIGGGWKVISETVTTYRSEPVQEPVVVINGCKTCWKVLDDQGTKLPNPKPKLRQVSTKFVVTPEECKGKQ